MKNDVQSTAIFSAGMKLLRDNLGAIETEIFISIINSSFFDYTAWREDLWENLSPRELYERASKTEEEYTVPAGVTVIKDVYDLQKS